MNGIASTKLFKVAALIMVFAFLVAIDPVGVFGPIRNMLAGASSPFNKFAYSLSVASGQARDFLSSIGQLKSENENLIKENQQLMAQSAQAKDLKQENDLLRQQLGLLPRDRYDMISASVIGQDPNGLGNWLEIDKGSADGLEQGMSVIVSDGILVGRIQNVDSHDATVSLLTNPKSTINVMDADSGAKGVVRGEYGLGMIFDMILQTDSVQSGNTVVTSGIGGGIPKGLYVGKVQDVHPSDDHLFQQAVVVSPVQVSKLQIVFAVKGEKK